VKLLGLRLEATPSAARVVCRVEWEDSERPAFDLFFETPEESSADLSPNPNAFLLGAILPAFRRQERRISLEGPVCPMLRDGLYAAMAILKGWYAPKRLPTVIEPSAGFRAADRAAVPMSALFLTAGVDSLYSLWKNRQRYPRGHAASFRHAIYIPSFAFPEEFPSDRTRDLARRQLRSITAVARAEGLRLLTVTTNLRRLDPDVYFTAREGLSAILASAAHLFSKTLTSAVIAPALPATNLRPDGDHPLLGPLYSTGALRVTGDRTLSSRLERLRRIAGWETALANLFVCFEGPLPEGSANCGRCEKCLRTMTELLVCEVLDHCRTFPKRNVEVEEIEVMSVGYHPEMFPTYWAPLVEPLEALGRSDLAGAIARKLRMARGRAFLNSRREAIRRFDRDRLGGAIRSASRAARGLPLDRGAP
jgi:hypothetical protein